MNEFKATDRWYKEVAENETGHDISAGLDTTFRATDTRNKRVIEWIKIEKDLPKDQETVMVSITIPLHEFRFAFYNKGEFFINSLSDENLTKWITHWASIEGLAP